jgi:hypothetical protein
MQGPTANPITMNEHKEALSQELRDLRTKTRRYGQELWGDTRHALDTLSALARAYVEHLRSKVPSRSSRTPEPEAPKPGPESAAA